MAMDLQDQVRYNRKSLNEMIGYNKRNTNDFLCVFVL